MSNQSPNIIEIIENKRIIPYFQPIISIKQKSLVGLEALCRGIDEHTGGLISPLSLFEQAEKQGLTVELDRLCREKALDSFQASPDNNELLLAINLKTSIIDQGVVGSKHLLNQVKQFGLTPGNIIIEIVESEVKNINALTRFVQDYKSYGFLIALDDFGAGYSNLERISLIKPDIIKIDRSLLHNFNREDYKQEMFKSIIELSHKLGALVLAEGIETAEEAILAHEMGADLLQGYFFSRPVPISDAVIHQYDLLIQETSVKFKNAIMSKIQAQKTRNDRYELMINNFIIQLSTTIPERFNEKLASLIVSYSNVECIYILDESGVQVSDTICGCYTSPRQTKYIFRPAQKGADQSLKDYYLLIQTGLNKYITEPYISMASGNTCVTISAVFNNIYNHRFILCLDICSEMNE